MNKPDKPKNLTAQEVFQREVILDQFTVAYDTLLAHCIKLERKEKDLGTDECYGLINHMPTIDKMFAKIMAAREETPYNPYED